MNKILFEYTFLGQNGKQKNIRVIHGDLTQIESADVVVCSAFQGDYAPLYGTLIGALWRNKNIMVKDLADKPISTQKVKGRAFYRKSFP